LILVTKDEKCRTANKARISSVPDAGLVSSFSSRHYCGGVDDEVSIGDCAATSSTALGLTFSFSAISRIRGPYRST
jgi:hypothetical protein